jgi:hypothetical protein
MIFLGLIGVVTLVTTANSPDYGAWADKSPNGAWTRAAESAVDRSTLPRLVPSDIALYCPRYVTGDQSDRVRFWAALLSAMARPESGFDPAVQFVEPNITDAKGRHVVSRGLLQISIESANQPRYRCGIQRAKDLHRPGKNLACATKILNYWVAGDDSIGVRDGENLGGARYWSALRREKDVTQIQAYTRQLSFCVMQ